MAQFVRKHKTYNGACHYLCDQSIGASNMSNQSPCKVLSRNGHFKSPTQNVSCSLTKLSRIKIEKFHSLVKEAGFQVIKSISSWLYFAFYSCTYTNFRKRNQ